jgi:hypothetical protein
VLRNGRYTDTSYNPDIHTTQPVGFATDTYFDLLAAVPELGQYFALGQNVLVVYEGQVYETVTSGGAETIVLPEVAEVYAVEESTVVVETATSTTLSTGVSADPNSQPTDADPDPQPTSTKPEAGDLSTGICGTAMLMPLFIVTGLVGLKRKKNS